jgi:hypothetical protein
MGAGPTSHAGYYVFTPAGIAAINLALVICAPKVHPVFLFAAFLISYGLIPMFLLSYTGGM